jgi:ring-1,2-phenylacetyl-CoA epoxidase subunit PaaE
MSVSTDQSASAQNSGPSHLGEDAAASVRRRSRADFHSLTVANVDPLTDDSAAITFRVPADLAADFAFQPGQSLTVRRGEERRSYSICAPAIRPGDTLDVQVPTGTFTPDLSVPGRHVLIAAGSGITPMMSIAASVLAADDKSTVTLIYGNRRSDTVMFADEVADLKDAHPARMHLVHVLSREPQEVDLFSGRLDPDRLTALLPATVDVAAADHWWLCGPYGLVTGATEVLRELGVQPGRIHRELFYVGDDPPVEATHEDAPVGAGASVTVILDGRSTALTLPAGTAILDGAQRVRPDLPFACKGGVCGTCRARVTDGTAVMRRNYALEPAEVEAGYVLTCQALPTTPELTVDYDS